MRAAALLLLAGAAAAADVRAVRRNIDAQKDASRGGQAALAEVSALRQDFPRTEDLGALAPRRAETRARAEAALARLEAVNKAAHDDILAYGHDQGQRLYAGLMHGEARELSSLVTGREADIWARKVAWILSNELRAEEHDWLTGLAQRESRRVRRRRAAAGAAAAVAVLAPLLVWRRRLWSLLTRTEVDVIDLRRK